MRKVLAVICGIVAGFAIVFIGDATTHSISPVPRTVDIGNRDDMRVYIESIPVPVLIIMVVFWLGSSFLAAMLASRINRSDWRKTSLITGGILFAACLLNLVMIPHPTWMWITALIGYLPAALLGGWLMRAKSVPLP